jgi:phosphatidyl-myo-inositol dimannoside synthase
MNSVDMGVLGLFPSIASEKIGGVEASGRLAWQGIVDGVAGDASLFCYGSQGPGESRGNARHEVHAASRLSAVLAALRTRQTARLVLIWHIDLLKLLPFLRVADARVALFLHGIEAWRRQDWLSRILLRRVDLFLSNSDYTWQRFLSFNPRLSDAPHRSVPLGLGAPVKAAVPAPAHPPAVLMLSRLCRGEDYKGHREMIAAWPLVQKWIPAAELWIAGDGDLRPDLEGMVRDRGLDGGIHFWGQVSEDEKQSLLARCRCLSMPSRGEGFG